MLVPVLLFLVGFALLIKGGDWFVDGAVGIARRFHLPELLIGATVVSIGTTLPEVMVSSLRERHRLHYLQYEPYRGPHRGHPSRKSQREILPVTHRVFLRRRAFLRAGCLDPRRL